MSVEKSKTFLFAPIDAWGHINSCHGLAEELLNRGHRVVFAIDKAFENKLSPFGFVEELLTTPESEGGDKWPIMIEQVSNALGSKDPIDVALAMRSSGATKMIQDILLLNSQYKNIISRVSPDLIIVDNYINSPAITNCGRPWVWLYSAQPLGLYNSGNLPPPGSGYPTNSSDRTKWTVFNEKMDKAARPLFEKLNKFCISEGAPPIRPEDRSFHPFSPDLNIYLYIKELDYNSDGYHLPNNFLRVENLIRKTDEKFEIPQKLLNKSGGLVFLSMGSFGCAYVKLMTRLTQILSKSKHRFIVAKGPNHDKYELPDNMWGHKFVPQTAVLPLVDLVITHGGNNTVTEAFYFGKPLLVLPLFSDQYDNAQRIQETGLGLRLNPFHCTEEELISSVDKLISDQSLIKKYRDIGKRMRDSNDKKKAVDFIENIV